MLMLFVGYTVAFVLVIAYVLIVASRLSRLENELGRLDRLEDGGKIR